MPDDSRLAIRLLTLGVALLAFGARVPLLVGPDIPRGRTGDRLSPDVPVFPRRANAGRRVGTNDCEADAMDEELRSPHGCPAGDG